MSVSETGSKKPYSSTDCTSQKSSKNSASGGGMPRAGSRTSQMLRRAMMRPTIQARAVSMRNTRRPHRARSRLRRRSTKRHASRLRRPINAANPNRVVTGQRADPDSLAPESGSSSAALCERQSLLTHSSPSPCRERPPPGSAATAGIGGTETPLLELTDGGSTPLNTRKSDEREGARRSTKPVNMTRKGGSRQVMVLSRYLSR